MADAKEVSRKAQEAAKIAAQKAQEAAEEVKRRGKEYVAEPAKTMMQRLRGMSYTKWAALLVGVGILMAVGTALLVVLGIPALVIGGGALLLFSPIILLTSPLWIPVVLFFVTITGIFLAFVGTTSAGIFALWWVYRYFRTPLPPGGQQVYQLKEYAKDTIQKTAQLVADKGHDLQEAVSG
ncbi:hypothetical protein CBR_g55162 [Chara braunii]|uniref:Oleosin n=1 Tax=Chara braunii TaxID=69332 RepID=A0A388MCN0_CHABU|nr:hypothetical protein CBR_g55162 [Chara braunii]|eukprot:GBG92317.1 hypothetical protein CBR_g55162 [Chara braunii]